VQNKYSELNISQISWNKCEFSFTELNNASIYPNFKKWVDICQQKEKFIKFSRLKTHWTFPSSEVAQ